MLLPLLLAGFVGGQCAVDTDCNQGDVCDRQQVQTSCTCSAGVDSCRQLGTCATPVPFCSTDKAKQQLAAANAQVVACDPFLPNSCSGGLECQPSSAGVQLVCKDDVGIITVDIGGVCVPADRKPLSARFSADGKQIVVSLNAAARSAAIGCSSLFDSTALGSRAWCVAADRALTVQLGSSATLQPGDELQLHVNQSALVDKLQSEAAFKGKVVVDACTECSPPTATITGPQVWSVRNPWCWTCLTYITYIYLHYQHDAMPSWPCC